jgi:hypothetical protein
MRGRMYLESSSLASPGTPMPSAVGNAKLGMNHLGKC